METQKKIRTRYAPSPTGYFHIGGARTALFNYLFAKHYGGDFILRIEDTDISRNVENGESSQMDNLKWMGITPDESPEKPVEKFGKYRQSEKLERYTKIIQKLINENIAYKAYDSSEEILIQKNEQIQKGIFSFRYDPEWLKISEEEKQRRDENKKYSVRIRLPKNYIYQWNDLVRGEIKVNSDDIGDWVICKSDGWPTYNFAVVIDDHDMEITHVLRGEEHITNTPKQLAVYQAMKWETPHFGHLTLITNSKGVKLSKRDNTLKQFIADYRQEGYFPWAICNYLALIGWTAEDSSEVMSKEELIKKFDPKRLSKSPSKFDMTKMQWFGKQYLEHFDSQDILNYLNSTKDSKWLSLFIETYIPSSYNLKNLKDDLNIYEKLDKKENFTLSEQDHKVINHFGTLLKNSSFEIKDIQKTIEQTSKDLQIKGKDLFMPIRLGTTWQSHGPELAKAIFLFGQETIYKRLGL